MTFSPLVWREGCAVETKNPPMRFLPKSNPAQLAPSLRWWIFEADLRALGARGPHHGGWHREPRPWVGRGAAGLARPCLRDQRPGIPAQAARAKAHKLARAAHH